MTFVASGHNRWKHLDLQSTYLRVEGLRRLHIENIEYSPRQFESLEDIYFYRTTAGFDNDRLKNRLTELISCDDVVSTRLDFVKLKSDVFK